MRPHLAQVHATDQEVQMARDNRCTLEQDVSGEQFLRYESCHYLPDERKLEAAWSAGADAECKEGCLAVMVDPRSIPKVLGYDPK